eukprot:2673605-Karenia_brevis.AAC.1
MGLSPKMISFSAAISKFEKVWQWKRAAPPLDEMCARSLLPSMCSFTFSVLSDRIAEVAKARLKDVDSEPSNFVLASSALDAIAKMAKIHLTDCQLFAIPSHASPVVSDAMAE